MTFPNLSGNQFNRSRHGGLYDRGRADSYYNRPKDPHWYPKGTGTGERISDLTDAEVAEYIQGYEDNERDGEKKIWD